MKLSPGFLCLLVLAACSSRPQVELAPVQVRTLVASVTESGTVQPELEVAIAPDLSGEVTAIHVREGQYVHRGQLLFEIRPDNYQAALEQSTASVNAAKAEQSNAEAGVIRARNQLTQDSVNWRRQALLYKDKVVSEQEYQQAELAYSLSRASYVGAQETRQAAYYRSLSAGASMRQSLDQLQRTRVYASVEGTVTYLKLEMGQRVVGTGMMAGTEVIKLADLREMQLKVSINENDIVHVRPGDTATITVDAYRDRVFSGRVTEIAYSAALQAQGTTDQVTNYAVEVRILRESYARDSSLMRGLKAHESPFRPGMSGVVQIYTDRADSVLAVPIQAVTVDRSAEPAAAGLLPTILYVWQPDGTVRTRQVSTGLSDDQYIEIKNGLKKGERIVVGPFTVIEKELEDGQAVDVMDGQATE